jgi:hypothetical protein
MAIDWGRIGAGLQGFSEGFFPAYEARALKRYRDAQTADLLTKSRAMQLYMEELARQRAPEPPPPSPQTSPGVERRRLKGQQTPPPERFSYSFQQPSAEHKMFDSPLGRGLTRAFQPQPIRGKLSPSVQGLFGTVPERDQPSPLLRQIQQAGFAVPPDAPPPTQPTYRESVVEDDLFHPEPPKYDPKHTRLQDFAFLAGGQHYEPYTPTPEWEQWNKIENSLIDQAIAMIGKTPTKYEYTDRTGRDITAWVPLELMMNPSMVKWINVKHPAIAKALPPAFRTDDPTQPGAHLTEENRNAQYMQENLSPDEIVKRERMSPWDPNNPMLQHMSSAPPSGMLSLPNGGVSVQNISPENKRFLMQMVPLSKVTMLIADKATKLNQEDRRFLAELTAVGQTVDSWFGLEYFLDPNEPGIDPLEKNKRLQAKAHATIMAADVTDEQRKNLKGFESSISDDLRHLAKLRNSFAGLFAELGGERGRKTEDDVKRAKQMLAGLGDTAGLTRDQIDLMFSIFVGQYNAILHGPTGELNAAMQNMQEWLDRNKIRNEAVGRTTGLWSKYQDPQATALQPAGVTPGQSRSSDLLGPP